MSKIKPVRHIIPMTNKYSSNAIQVFLHLQKVYAIEKMSSPQNDSVCSPPESKHVETKCLADVYKPGLLCPEQTMWTHLNDSGIVAESSLSIIDTNNRNDVVKGN